ncbi:hypothetical protein [Paracoccus salipaludis]|uniref:hypothetical protein n=1 Tax=Paracoccus salipaludis TaxID=2032623 RepID=UPI001071DEA7|nr:hypothetical protein [Paracoccus salipaludis]
MKQRTNDIYSRAQSNSEQIAANARDFIDQFVKSKLVDTAGLCFAATGSVGRREALEASDLDLVPIARDDKCLAEWAPHDAELRQKLKEHLKIKVSRGEDLTKACSLTSLTRAEKIGGNEDNSAELTKRVLLLTETISAGGGMPIEDVRAGLLEAYGSEHRTSGRHVLSLCNDVARYYKTLCIEYIPRAIDPEKDWCTRNIKLRHSRKFWYFSNMMAVATLADRHPHGDQAFKDALLAAFSKSPIERLADAVLESQPLGLGRLLETYGNFLDFMSRSENRNALADVAHERRYEMELNNPFPTMKFNSDLLHSEIMAILEEAGVSVRSRVIGWFML